MSADPSPSRSLDTDVVGSASCPCRTGQSVRSVVRTDLDRCLVLAELDHHTTSPVAVGRALLFYPSLYGVIGYRLAHAARSAAVPAPARLLLQVLTILLQRVLTTVTGVEMSAQAHIGPGLFVNHAQGVVVGSLEAGSNLTLSHGTTIGRGTGGGGQSRLECPVLGDRVWVGVNAVVTGDLLIGDDVMIGANAVVLKDVPPRGVAVGVPARVISREGSFGNVVYRGMDDDLTRALSRSLATRELDALEEVEEVDERRRATG